ncbi:hypothetical protein KL86PLE_100499 [uncultured Pleomorphomonas sp.]|uniref:Uncharacterized protein n=1 Tax=uncultured Pleomorphomonas sp. TaxID=442121 RepID=A0A212L3P2_9HYPH|nr:hypothetical protein KL86PLE_100499 [uncultured Pleomorphomonas sp.]
MFTVEDWPHRIQERTEPKNSRFGEFIQPFAGFGLAGGQALSRKLSTTRFWPALSKSTVTLLPSTAATEPGQGGAEREDVRRTASPWPLVGRTSGPSVNSENRPLRPEGPPRSYAGFSLMKMTCNIILENAFLPHGGIFYLLRQ